LYVVLAAGLLLGLAALVVQRPDIVGLTPVSAALALFASMWVLTSPTYPWYALLAVALLPLASGPVILPAAAIALTAPLLYLHISVGSHPAWPRHLAYGLPALALAAAAVRVAQRRGAVASSRTPSSNETLASNPSSAAARSVEANT